MAEYPEHEKLHKAKAELGTEEIGAFLDWLGSDGIQLARFWKHEVNCERSEERDRVGFQYEGENGYYRHKEERCGYQNEGVLIPSRESIQKLLARYADVDLEKLEDEKRAMLDELRATQKGDR